MNTMSQGRTVRRKAAPAVELNEKLTFPAEKAPRIKSASLADQVANQAWHYKSHFIPELKKAFPEDFEMWHVDRYYPTAQGGPILMDEPRSEWHAAKAKIKQAKAKEMGLRFVIVTPKTSLEEALVQLGEL